MFATWTRCSGWVVGMTRDDEGGDIRRRAADRREDVCGTE